ncbi:MAG: heavy metal translocating P-type ATPase [Campylobacteraceae bacterium]|nr:heavy metal translocating P-type ATPase [Campylobacteraceae bacterium]
MSKENIKLNISGMTCVNCSNGIEKISNKMKGLSFSKVSFTSNSGEFIIDTEHLSKHKLINKIKALGYEVVEDLEELEKNKIKAYVKLKNTFFISLTLTSLMFYFMFFPKENNTYILFLLASIVQFYCGLRFYTLSYKALSHNNYDMNVLVALGTSAAYFYSAFVVISPTLFPENLRFVYFDGAAVIITFILLGRLLEERSRAKASDFLKSLMNLAPLKANIIKDNGDIKQIPAKDLEIGDIVLIKQGEQVSADCLIIKGYADINASMITGESMPVYKTIGDEIIAGTINTNGVIEAKVLKKSSDTKISKIIDLLSLAQSKQMPIARFADKVANIFVPLVIGISILTFLVWYFIVGNTLMAILASISVLIISCPCALGLATPIAIVSSVAAGAKEGILIKNPEVLEIIKDIRYAVFDKTGTLTKGEIKVKDMDIDEKYLNLIYALEKVNEHAISKAIINYIDDKNIKEESIELEEFKNIPGRGLSAKYNNELVLIGNIALLEENNISIAQVKKEFYLNTLNKGNVSVLVSYKNECKGSISLEDEIKEGAIELIKALNAKNIQTILLTGDNKLTAKNIANTLGIKTIYSEVLPNEKYDLIKSLQNNSKIMFVGDGVNDSPSIKQADIGITLNSGSDITKDAGDIILMNNDIACVLKSINLSFKTMKIIKQNLFWAFFYNALGIPLAAGIFYSSFGIMLSPMYAGIAMSFSSVIVVLNSLRLKMYSL